MITAAHVIGALLRFLIGLVRAWPCSPSITGSPPWRRSWPLAAAVLFYRRVLSRSAQVRRRARALRWRARLRLRPGPGYASLPELWLRWGRLAALHHGRRMRPGLGFWARLFSPVTAYAVRLGRAQYVRRCLRPRRGPDADPGPAADRQVRHHRRPAARSSRPGHRHLDPGGPVPPHRGCPVAARPRLRVQPAARRRPAVRLLLDLLDPCADLVMARRMAAWLTGAMTGADSNLGNLEWFTSAADTALMAHAPRRGDRRLHDHRRVRLVPAARATRPPLRVLAAPAGERAARRRAAAGAGEPTGRRPASGSP